VVTANDKDKFATYFRDSSTGLDYAVNRYYGSNVGRFLTPDPFGGSAKWGNPSSWNRYTYVENDPINKNDPSGLFLPGDFTFPWWEGWGWGPESWLDPINRALAAISGIGGAGVAPAPSRDEQGREIMDSSERGCARGILQPWFSSLGYSQDLSKVQIAYAQGNELLKMEQNGDAGKSIGINKIVFGRPYFNPSAAKTQDGIGYLAHELAHNMQRILNPNFDQEYSLEEEYWKAQGLTGKNLHDANKFERAATAKENEVLADLKKHFGDKNPCP
jgi:RHS repeat-associated protein